MTSPSLPDESSRSTLSHLLAPVVLISALGYFVDIYDLLLFSIVRVPSLRAIGVPEADLLSAGVRLINVQMAGLLIGGFLWGILGDRRGRRSVLFASILIYSIANLLNAFVQDLSTYAGLRFFAGLGLAGELGAAVTLVSETLPSKIRGYGATVIAGIGLLGAAFAGWMAEVLSWRGAYFLGGALGLILLVARVQIKESPLFQKWSAHPTAQLRLIFLSRRRFSRYLLCVLVGVPVWYTVGILITFAPEITRALEVTGPVSAGRGILFCYGASCIGDAAAGILSQRLKSRKKTIAIFMVGTFTTSLFYLSARQVSPSTIYWLFALIGVAGGYWALFMVTATELFGSNIRATVTTTAPNLVRAMVIPLTSIFHALIPSLGIIASARAVGLGTLLISGLSLALLPETFDRDLNTLESHA